MKRVLIAMLLVGMMMLVGCGEPKTYGLMTDYSIYDTEDYHVVYSFSADGCYSDGSFESNQAYNEWLKKYKETH